MSNSDNLMFTFLNTDAIQKCLSYSDTPEEYQRLSLVCKKFHTANQKLRFKKAIQSFA